MHLAEHPAEGTLSPRNNNQRRGRTPRPIRAGFARPSSNILRGTCRCVRTAAVGAA